MSRWILVFVSAVLFGSLFGSSCTNMPGPGNMNTNDNNNGNDNTSNGPHALKIQFDAPTGVSNVRVAVFVDKGSVDRSEAGDPIPWTHRTSYDPSGTNGATYSIPHGSHVCLVCDENPATSSPANTGVDPLPVVTLGQFVDWQGDTQGATGGNDAGILNFTMTGDRTITARFSLMYGVVIRSQGGANGTGTSLDIDIENQAPLTLPPQHLGNSRNVNIVGTGLTGQQGKIGKYHYFRDGTTIIFTVPTAAPFTSWSGDGAIGGRTVTFTFGARTQTADLNWP